jgi:hypothetical protein
VINEVAPCLLPDADLIKQVDICGQRYWPIVLDGETLADELRYMRKNRISCQQDVFALSVSSC